jgi:hypothetical protein
MHKRLEPLVPLLKALRARGGNAYLVLQTLRNAQYNHIRCVHSNREYGRHFAAVGLRTPYKKLRTQLDKYISAFTFET